ncbi:diacylglycerol kinase family enzyme [Flavobacterium sp. CG_9.10]|uniref:diacylglycerol/lipid kinase family protein n=1 Tax=Flavobacterium sp. CG_9.10 TaxID=2787729 RepID=UPI0018C8ECDA|nr:diacylglycerol kinase family protein [Flavobacterium sp. CG_9.10]MBG6110366.1 diacylglycerol kinase family enzyme [Flavobacterium sp. CG_9.10]
MRKNIIMIVNPISGDLDKSELTDAAFSFAEEENLNLVIYNTSGVNDIINIQALYLSYKPERIIVAGGDGTIKMVSEALQKEDVILGILPAGSANGLAVDLDLMLTLEENLQIAFQNDFMEIDVITINDKISLHLSDLGLNAELIKNYENATIRGKWGYALQAVNTLIDFEGPFTATITANDETINCVARMIVIANSKKYGTGVVINPEGEMNDGKFELVILKNLDLYVFGQIVTGNMPIESNDVEIISTNQAFIKTNFPVSFQMDGEYCGTETEYNVEILHKQMKVAIP